MPADASVEFREVMRGGFTPGATDPRIGGREGVRAGSYLTLRATATIPDVREFVRDREHTGVLTGTVTFPSTGADNAPARGVFKLFAPTNDPDLKLMIYRACFQSGGRNYCLDGAKHVRRHSVLHSWGDTTTLYCRLHDSEDTSGAVVAAGVLHLGPAAFARQLTSFRTPGAAGVATSVRALGGFLSFFSAELLDTYVSRRR